MKFVLINYLISIHDFLQLHPPPVNPENVLKLIEWLDDKQLTMLTPSLLGPHPNCYTYSKRLAEAIVGDAYHELPLVIARPSIGEFGNFLYLS